MKQYGLIGRSISYSFSPGYFKEKFKNDAIKDCRYDLFPLKDLAELPELLSVIEGINVTIPYKQEVLEYCDELSPEVKKIGAANCLKVENGKVLGFNTDYYGFKTSLIDFLGDETADLHALVLGQGGAAAAIKVVLSDLNIPYTPISRNPPHRTYESLTSEDISNHRLIINTTPLGTHPDIEECPDIDYSAISTKHFLYDLIYNPEKTLFLNNGMKQGAKIKNGLEMLKLQADKSWEIWNQSTTLKK